LNYSFEMIDYPKIFELWFDGWLNNSFYYVKVDDMTKC
jgi:hypothetical protein